jgi:hypothetical protein
MLKDDIPLFLERIEAILIYGCSHLAEKVEIEIEIMERVKPHRKNLFCHKEMAQICL